MGVLYKIRCERCGVVFEHQVGVGLIYACVGCGDMGNERAPFWCPVCNKRYSPEDEHFGELIEEVVVWD